MNEQILSEIATEMAELEREFANRLAILKKKLRLAAGGGTPAPVVTELVSWNGKRGNIGESNVGRKRKR